MSVAHQAGELARAVHAVLASDLRIQSVLGEPARLYDAAPEDPVFPYLTYGSMRSADIGADATVLGRHQMTLHLWSRYSGRAEVMSGVRMIADALTAESLTSAGSLAVISANTLYSDILRAPDGRTHHGLLRLSFTIQSQIPTGDTP